MKPNTEHRFFLNTCENVYREPNLNLSVKVRFEGFKFLQWSTYTLECMLDV